MFSLSDKERLVTKREASYKAECAMADSIDVLAAMVSLPVKDRAERVYCYCSLRGKNAMFVAFYTVGDKAFLFSDELNKSELMDFNMAVMSQLVYLKGQYEGCPELMPSELFLDFDPGRSNINAFVSMEDINDPNIISIRSLVWYKEHGGKLKRSTELAMKMGPFKALAEANCDPAANATALDRDALELSRKYIAGEIAEPALTAPETGWDAARAEIVRACSADAEPMSFESDDGESWVDVYEANDCWQYLSCGLSAMGSESSEGSLGAEYVISLKKKSNQDEDDAQIFAMLNMLRDAIASAQRDKAMMADFAYLSLDKGGLMAVPETKLKAVNAPGGTISFKKLVYITDTELSAIEGGSIDAQSLYAKLGTDVSTLGRKSLI